MNNRLALWRRLGLRGRLLLLLVPVLVLAGAALHALQLQREAAEYRADMIHEAEHLMGLLAASLVEPAVSGDFATAGQIVRRIGSPLIAHVEWRGRSGGSVAARGLAPAPIAPSWFRRHFAIPQAKQIRELEVGGEHYGLIRVEFSAALLENRLWRATLNQLWQYGLELSLLVPILSVFLARWLRPLEAINAAGQRFMGGDYSVRIQDPARYVPEIRAMAEMLNQAVKQVGGLVQSLSEQRRVIDNAVIVIESDLRGVITYVNDKFCEASGYSRDEVIGRDHRFLSSGYHARSFFEEMWATLENGEIWQGEICNRSKNGGVLWLLTTITPVFDAGGKPFKYISVRVNITRRKLVENVLAQQAQIIDQTHDAVFSTDLVGTLVSWNRGAELLFGYSAHEAVGQPVRFIAPPGEESDFHARVFLALGRGGGGALETLLQKKSGEVFAAHFSLTLLRDDNGLDIGVACYALDITERKKIENALRASEKKYRALVESMHDWVWEVNEHGVYTYSSPRVREMLGYGSEEMLGKTPFDLMPREEADRVGAIFSAIAAVRAPIRLLENLNIHKNGAPIVLETSATPIFDEQGNFRGYQGIDRDITERKQIENALREREANLAFAQRVAHLGSWEWHPETGGMQWSDEVFRIWGFAPGAFAPNYEQFLDSIHPDDRELVEKSFAAALLNEVLLSFDHRIALPDGGVRFVHEEAQVLRHESGKAISVAGTVQDITERQQAEQEIRASREQLRELSNHLQTVREEEKVSIAREIHDELGGNLTALKMDIFWLARKLPEELDVAREKVASMSDVVDASVHAMRRIVTELRPTVLDDLGLLAAMQWQAAEFGKRYNIQCKVTMHGDDIELAEEIRIALFRIFQEALTNVARYSHASLVAVDMWREHGKIALEVFDNGIGIPEGAIMQPTSHGLRGMMERARSLGGSMEVGSAPGEGVAISVRIPLPGTAEEEA